MTFLLFPDTTVLTNFVIMGQTFAVITRRQLSAIFVTDDMDARALAAAELEAPTYGTADLLKLAVHVNQVTVDAAWASISLLRARGRYVPGAPFNFNAFRSWCAG